MTKQMHFQLQVECYENEVGAATRAVVAQLLMKAAQEIAGKAMFLADPTALRVTLGKWDSAGNSYVLLNPLTGESLAKEPADEPR